MAADPPSKFLAPSASLCCSELSPGERRAEVDAEEDSTPHAKGSAANEKVEQEESKRQSNARVNSGLWQCSRLTISRPSREPLRSTHRHRTSDKNTVRGGRANTTDTDIHSSQPDRDRMWVGSRHRPHQMQQNRLTCSRLEHLERGSHIEVPDRGRNLEGGKRNKESGAHRYEAKEPMSTKEDRHDPRALKTELVWYKLCVWWQQPADGLSSEREYSCSLV